MFGAVNLDPRAEGNSLAQSLRHRIESNLAKHRARKFFPEMWGTVVLVCRASVSSPDARALPSTLTLRFDFGKLFIHEGRVGRPDVTLWGTEVELLGGDGSLSGVSRALLGQTTVGLRSDRGRVGLRIYGALRRPRFVSRLLRLLSRD